ncbi:MAG TPA: PKD domain-containing protein, partial [Solirubrobacteraceae bacterium]|nr:PKD domain-containing protein [Solirubrobacteraceae bacterium]
TYPHYGLYNATLTVTDSANGHTSTASHTVLVSDESPSTPSISTPSGRAASPILFLGYAGDPDGSITSYRWTFGDGGSATGSQVTHTYTSAGQYVVVLTVTDSDGRSASTATTITVGPALNHGHPNSCHVPKLKGKTLSQAKQALKNAGCATGKITKAKKPKRSAGRHHKWQLEVVHQTPGAGKLEQPGSKVALKLAYVAVKTR